VLEEAHDREEIIQRVAALDIGKARLTCCVRVPSPDQPGRRLQEVTTHQTMTRSLLVLADRLRALGVTRVVMEATSDYWKGPFYLLEAYGLEVWLVNARDVKHLPGRPKTDKLDAVWLCKVAERQMLRPSFVPPPEIRRQRVEKLLEDAGDQTVGGRLRHLRGLRPGDAGRAGAGQHARQARPTGGGVHRPLLRPSRLPAANHAVAHRPGQRRHRRGGGPHRGGDRPFAEAVDRLDAITGVGRVAAQVIIAEVGLDMGRFPTPTHLASWARYAPGIKESAGKKKGKATTGHGNPYLARVLGEVAVAAGRTNTFLGERYRRLARRRGAKKAVVAVGRSILIIIWHLLADPTVRYRDLGPGFYDTRINAERTKRNHVRQLQALGYKVTLEPAA
jgi:transposase